MGVLAGTPVSAQTGSVPPDSPPRSLGANEASVLDGVQFAGLRHISSAAVAAQLSLHEGEEFNAEKLRRDIHALGRLGWFESIQVEKIAPAGPDSGVLGSHQRVALLFHFEEQPILSRVEYSGSRLLSPKQIDKLLEEKKLTLGLGKPANPAVLQQI